MPKMQESDWLEDDVICKEINLMATERDRAKDYKTAYDQANAGFGAWQGVVKKDLTAYLSDPWTEKDRLRFLKENRESASFPQIRMIINWISGYQSDNIRSIRYDPTEDGDVLTAEQFTAIGTWSMQHTNGYDIISDAFEGCLKCAMNLVNAYNDRNSDTKLERFGYNQFLLDPTFSRRDLEDCSYGMIRKYITKDDAKMLLPGKESFIESIDVTVNSDAQGDMFPYYQRPQLYGDRLLAYDEFQQRTTVEKKIILIKPLNKEIVWEGTKRQLPYFMRYMVQKEGIPPELLSVITRWEPTVEVSTFLEGTEVNHGIDLFGIGDFSFTPIIAYFDPDHDRMEIKLQSIVRGLVDAQRASDKRMMAMTSVFEQQIGAGVDFEEGAFVDDEDAFKTGAGKPRLLKEGKLERIRDRVIPDIPQGMFQFEDLTVRKMYKSAGINEEMTGQAEGGNPQIAGYLAKLRIAGGLIGLKGIFRNLALSQKTIGRKKLKLYQQYPLDKVRRILNQEPSPQFQSREFGKYDCATVEGVITDTQKNMFYADLVQLTEMLIRLKQPVPPFMLSMLLKNAPIAGKPELLKMIQQYEQQQSQQAQEQKQKQDMMQQLEIERVKGEIFANRGIAEAQRAKAVEDISDAALNRVKVIAEINDMGASKMLELVGLGLQFEQIKQQNREVTAKS